MRKVEVKPVVEGALGTVTKYFEKWIEKLDFDYTIEALQKPCLIEMARIIWKVLDMKWKKAAIPKTTCWCPLLWPFFYHEITSDLRVNEILINNNIIIRLK